MKTTILLSDLELQENIIKRMKNYEWGKLWSDVQHIQINSQLSNNEKILLLSTKAMLLGKKGCQAPF